MIEHGEGIVEYCIWGECLLYASHVFWFVKDRVNLCFLGCSTLCLEVPFFVAVEAFVWHVLPCWGLVNLHCVSLCLLVLSWGTCSVTGVHRDWQVAHPQQGIGWGYLSQCMSLYRLLISLGKLWLVAPLKRSEIGCVLHDQVNELHWFDDGHHAFFHVFVGFGYWWAEYFVK